MRTPPPPASTFLAIFFFSIFLLAYDGLAVEQQPLDPGDFPSGGSSSGGGVAGPAAGNTVPAFPVVQAQNNQTCRLDLSDELFGGVAEACGRDLDRGRCCPVLAAWLFAAHARSALEVRGAPSTVGDDGLGDDDSPMMPDDSQKCVDSLQSSLQGRNIHLARPNASCDAVLCFCGIRLHQISSLSCPAAFNLSISSSSHSSAASYRNATPTAAVRDLEKSCRNSSYTGCTRCLASLDKLRGGVVGRGGAAGWGDRASRMLGRDCQLMGLTWLLARNRTAYIPTVSAVLRAIMYSAHPAANPPPPGDRRHGQPPQYKCSPDQENMPLAVDSLQFERADGSSSAASAALGGAAAVAAVLFSSPASSSSPATLMTPPQPHHSHRDLRLRRRRRPARLSRTPPLRHSQTAPPSASPAARASPPRATDAALPRAGPPHPVTPPHRLSARPRASTALPHPVHLTAAAAVKLFTGRHVQVVVELWSSAVNARHLPKRNSQRGFFGVLI